MRFRWKIAQAAEIRWWQNYLREKPREAYLAWKKRYWLEFLAQCGLSPRVDDRCLDAGCGPAGIFMALEGATDAVDPLLDSYEANLTHFRKSDYANVRFYNLPLEEFVAEEPYSMVFCLNAINHVSDLGLCFDRLWAATAGGGTLVVSIDAHNYRFFKGLFRLLPGDVLHPHQYDLREYEAMLTMRGLRIVKSVLMKKEFFFNYYALVAVKL